MTNPTTRTTPGEPHRNWGMHTPGLLPRLRATLAARVAFEEAVTELGVVAGGDVTAFVQALTRVVAAGVSVGQLRALADGAVTAPAAAPVDREAECGHARVARQIAAATPYTGQSLEAAMDALVPSAGRDPAAAERAAARFVRERHPQWHDVGVGIVQGSHYRAGFAAGAKWWEENRPARPAPTVTAEDPDALAGLVSSLQRLCDDEWLRRRDRIMRLPGARPLRDSGAGEIEQAASVVRQLIEGLPGYHPDGSGGAFLAWMRNGRDAGLPVAAEGEPDVPAHRKGANAEDCPACADTNPPYPFICPGDDRYAVAAEGGE